MPVRRTESRLPIAIGDRIFHAADLGQACADGDYALVSCLESPIVQGALVEYVAFATNGSWVDKYRWRVIALSTNEVWETETGLGMLSHRVEEPSELQVVVETVNKGQVSTTLSLNQRVLPSNPSVSSLLVSQGIQGRFQAEMGVIASEPQTSAEVINDLGRCIVAAANATGPYGIPPLFLAAVVYNEALYRPKELVWSRPHLAAYAALTGGEIVRPIELELAARELNETASMLKLRSRMNNSLGVCQIQPQTLAMLLDLTDWLQKPKCMRKRREINDRIFENYMNLSHEQKVDLFNLLRFPKTNIRLCAELLARLKNRAEPARFADLTQDELQNNEQALQIIATEFNVGPTTSSLEDAKPNEIGKRIVRLMSSPVLKILISQPSSREQYSQSPGKVHDSQDCLLVTVPSAYTDGRY